MIVKDTKSWSVLIYSLVLVTISLIMATIILKSSTTLSLNRSYINIKTKLSRVVSDNSRVVFKLAKELNSNGGWFVDTMSCPENFTMSGTTFSWSISTSLYLDNWSNYCSGSYDNGWWSKNLKIYYNTWFSDFVLAEYSWSLVNLVNSASWKKWNTQFSDSDNTLLDFSSYDYDAINIDGIDDNINSDDYKWSSTWSIVYPSGFQDDDDLHRKIKFWYISPNTGFNSIFWNNTKISKYIDNNINNSWAITNSISSTSTGVLFMNFDTESNMLFYKFDKQHFNTYGELKVLEKLHSTTIPVSEGFLQNNWGVLSLSGNLSSGPIGNEYMFNFTEYDYALFLSNTSSWVLSYNIRWFDSTGSWLYIVPIDDSDPVMLKYLWNSMIIDDEWKLIYEQKEVISSK